MSSTCCIELGHDAADTVGNARETAAWAKAGNYRSLRLVTSDYHMPRSLAVFRRAMPHIDLIAHPVFSDSVHMESWWRSPGTAGLLASEFNKFLIVRLSGLGERAPGGQQGGDAAEQDRDRGVDAGGLGGVEAVAQLADLVVDAGRRDGGRVAVRVLRGGERQVGRPPVVAVLVERPHLVDRGRVGPDRVVQVGQELIVAGSVGDLGGQVVGLSTATAAEFSFLLSIPAIAGAGIFEARDAFRMLGRDAIPALAVGTATAAISGYIAIAWLIKWLGSHDLIGFAIYRIVAGLAILGGLAARPAPLEGGPLPLGPGGRNVRRRPEGGTGRARSGPRATLAGTRPARCGGGPLRVSVLVLLVVRADAEVGRPLEVRGRRRGACPLIPCARARRQGPAAARPQRSALHERPRAPAPMGTKCAAAMMLAAAGHRGHRPSGAQAIGSTGAGVARNGIRDVGLV